MIKNIKLLIEGLFDDIYNSDDSLMDTVYDNNKDFANYCKTTLCINSDYHFVYEEDQPDFECVKEIKNENQYILYVGPYRTFDTCGFGPRKRKKYTWDYFYRYVLEFDENGKIILYIISKGDYPRISQQVYNFIENCYYDIKEIRFRQPGNDRNLLCCGDGIKTLYIFSQNNKISRKFINNFPTKISPEFNPQNLIKLFIKQFESQEEYFRLITKLVNMNANVKDENNITYNKDNIEEKTQYILSGKMTQEKEKTEQDKLDFIKKELGDVYFNKLEKIIDYYISSNTKLYLKTLNTFRTCKIKLDDTVTNLRKENNLFTESKYNVTRYNGILMYKMFYIMQEERLNSWQIRYNLWDCLYGEDSDAGGYGWNYSYSNYTKYIDLNDLPIKIFTPKDLYKLYYVLGKGITQLKGIENVNLELGDNDEYQYMEEAEKKIKEYNQNIQFNKNFNFNYLTTQLKTIIDKCCKKLKIK